jgi:hypothetical protein
MVSTFQLTRTARLTGAPEYTEHTEKQPFFSVSSVCSVVAPSLSACSVIAPFNLFENR